jgi:hypothetical protein
MLERADNMLHQFAASFPGRSAVGRDHVLVDAPGRFDLDMLVVGEQRGQRLALLVGEQV